MANFTKTVQNSIRTFGPAPSTKWGSSAPNTMTWGSSKWGEGTQDLIVLARKLLSNTITTTDSYPKGASRAISIGTLVLSFEAEMENLMDGSGYEYEFTGSQTDSDERSESTYTEDSDPGSSWSNDTDYTTNWSET